MFAEPALHDFAKEGESSEVARLLAESPMVLNAVNEQGESAVRPAVRLQPASLHLVIECQTKEDVRLLDHQLADFLLAGVQGDAKGSARHQARSAAPAFAPGRQRELGTSRRLHTRVQHGANQ